MALKMYLGLIVATLVLAFTSSGFYVVEQDEQAAIMTFGVFTATAGPGLHPKLPWPFQSVVKEKVSHVRRIEIGFRTLPSEPGQPANYRDFKADQEMLTEAQMVTGDENIVNTEIVVQYEISSIRDWLFNAENPDQILRLAAESALRQVVGDNGIDDVLIQKRSEISAEICDKVSAVANLYGLGVRVTSVQMQEALPPSAVSAAFKEVTTAREDSAKLLNQAMGYRNEKLHLVGGDIAKLKGRANGYAAERIAISQGETDRFKALAVEFAKNPDLMKQRLHLEMLQRVLPNIKKIIVDKDTGVVNLNKIDSTPVILNGGK